MVKRKSNICNKTSKLANLTEIFRQLNPKFKEQSFSTLIKEKTAEEGNSKILSSTQAHGGQRLTVTMSAKINVERKPFFLQKTF